MLLLCPHELGPSLRFWEFCISCRVFALRLRGPLVAWRLLKVHAIPMEEHRVQGGSSVHLTLRILQPSQARLPILRRGRADMLSLLSFRVWTHLLVSLKDSEHCAM